MVVVVVLVVVVVVDVVVVVVFVVDVVLGLIVVVVVVFLGRLMGISSGVRGLSSTSFSVSGVSGMFLKRGISARGRPKS